MAATERGLSKSETFEEGTKLQYKPNQDDFIGDVIPGMQRERPSTTPQAVRYDIEDPRASERAHTEG